MKKKYYAVEVLSVVKDSTGKFDIPFDYINTYLSLDKAKKVAKNTFKMNGVIKVSIHEWIKLYDENGSHLEETINLDFEPIIYNK